MWTFSKLNEESMQAINEAEKKYGVTLIAFSDDGIEYAELNDDAVEDLKALEEKLGLSLVALKA